MNFKLDIFLFKYLPFVSAKYLNTYNHISIFNVLFILYHILNNISIYFHQDTLILDKLTLVKSMGKIFL